MTGLALYNLGRYGEYHQEYHLRSKYEPNPHEVCSMQIISNSTFEDTFIPCFVLSTFATSQYNVSLTNTTSKDQVDIITSHINVSKWLNASENLLQVKPEQKCVVWHNTSYRLYHKEISCLLLQKYADTLEPPGIPMSLWLPLVLLFSILLICCCQCNDKKENKEKEPLNNTTATQYNSY